MKCPICGARLHPGADRCPDCGCHVRAYTAPAEEAHRSPKPRGRLILTILGILPVLCIILFTTLISFSVRVSHEPAVPEPYPDYAITVPVDPERDTLPEASEGCFSIFGGKVKFLQEQWDGNPVIRVPDIVDGKVVTGLAEGCFAGCDTLTTVILPDTLLHIGDGAFKGCIRLRGMYFPQGTRTVGTDAFAGCLDMEAIYVPASVTSIAPECFSDCASLIFIFYEGDFESWERLYDGYITPFTAAICTDGDYYHGTGR